MATTSDFRTGLCIEFNHDIFTIVDFQHVKPGKGPAFVRSKLKSLTNGKVLDHTWTAGVNVTTARVETREHTFIYKEGDDFVFMNGETFEQINIPEFMVDNADFMKEGQEVMVIVHAELDKPLMVELPPHVTLQVTYTEPGVKGNTATNSTKKATLETGAIVNVPLFIDQDEIIKIDSRTRAYVERVKVAK
jgi:elongation factor P